MNFKCAKYVILKKDKIHITAISAIPAVNFMIIIAQFYKFVYAAKTISILFNFLHLLA